MANEKFTNAEEFETIVDFENQLKEDNAPVQKASGWAKGWGNKEAEAPVKNEAPAKNDEEWKLRPAYIHKDTREVMKTNPYVKDAAYKLLAVATDIGQSVRDAGLKFEGKNQAGEKYDVKFVVKVEQASAWNKETERNELLTHKDGSPVYSPKIEFKANSTLTLYGKESDPAHLTSVVLNRFDKYHNKPVIEINQQIADDKYAGVVGKIAAHILDNGYIKGKEEIEKGNRNDPLFDYMLDMKKSFTEKVMVDVKEQASDGQWITTGETKETPDAYANFKNDDYGKRIEVKSHSEPELLVEFFNDKDNKPAVRVTNFDIKNEKNNQYAKVYINKPEDVKEYISQPEVQKAIADFKGFDMEKEISKKSPSVER